MDAKLRVSSQRDYQLDFLEPLQFLRASYFLGDVNGQLARLALRRPWIGERARHMPQNVYCKFIISRRMQRHCAGVSPGDHHHIRIRRKKTLPE